MLPKRRNIRLDLDNQEEVSSQNSTQHRLLQLYNSYRRMKAFSDLKDDQDFEKLEEIIVRYCGRTLNFDLSPKNVLDILDKRIERMLKNRKYKKNWSEEDTKILLWTYSHYANRTGLVSVDDTKKEDWQNISKLIPGSNPDSCMFKILSLKKVKLSEKKWTEIEENYLSEIVKKSKKRNWRLISQELYKVNPQENKIFRNAKQCKEHWVCYLNPDLKKGPWDPQEDKSLMDYVSINNGVKRWAEIAKIFKGRTQNALKNRYTLIIQRMKKEHPTINSQLELIEIFLKRLENGESNSSSQRRPVRGLRNYEGSGRNESPQIVQQLEQVLNQQPQNAENQRPPNINQSINSVPLAQNITPTVNTQQVPLNNVNYFQFCIPSVPNYIWIFTNHSN